jgi:hypothetical protein
MEFKVKYLCSYAALMRNYFVHMNMDEIATELETKNSNQALMIIIIACKFVEPTLDIPDQVEACNEEHMQLALQYMKTESFKEKFLLVC